MPNWVYMLLIGVFFYHPKPIFAESHPVRIVSSTLTSDEILLEILPRSRWNHILSLSPLAKNSDYSHINAKDISSFKVGPQVLETLMVSKPDLVILASFSNPAILDYVERKKVPHLRLEEFSGFKDIENNISRIAQAVGEEKRGKDLIQKFSTAYSEMERSNSQEAKKQKKPSVLSLSDGFLTMGSHTLFDKITDIAGGQNLAARYGFQDWKKVSVEKILVDRPDIIVIGHKLNHRDIPSWLQHSALKVLKAPKLEERICFVENRSLLSTSHHIIHAVEAVSKCIKDWRERNAKS